MALLTFVSLTSFGQNPIKMRLQDTRVLNNINGQPISRGDQFDIVVQADGNGNTTTRQLMFDFQYDVSNFDIISINHTGTGGNGGILPYGSTISLNWQNYPGYSYVNTNAQNAVSTNGNVRFGSTSYPYTNGGPNAIIRATLTWASPNGMPYAGGWDRFLIIRLRLKTASTATSFNPFRLNFVAGWNANGLQDETYQFEQLSTEILMNQSAGKFVTAKVDVNSNLYNLAAMRVMFVDSLTRRGQAFPILSDGKVDINQSLLTANNVYQVFVAHDMDQMYNVYNNAITISDFTLAQQEFTSMGLDGSAGNAMSTGHSRYAADINRNRVTDGGDLPQLLAQVAGVDTLYVLPAQYTVGSGGWRTAPTWRSTDATTVTGQTEWCVIARNSYSQGTSKVLIDMRKFGNTDPSSIKSIQLLDLYAGPAEFVSQDATWATYKIPSDLATVSTSVFQSSIRFIQGGDYGIKVEFAFNTSNDKSWTSLTAANWGTLTYPTLYFKTGELGTNAILDLKYMVWGDVNRSHSSQVVNYTNGSNTLVTNAKSSIATNSTVKTMNVTVADPTSIDVSLSNAVVTSNNIEIPVTVDTKGAKLGGLQFQFTYDPTKLKFEELKNEVPNTWYTFVNSKTGVVKFGSLDQNNKTSITGTATPFKLKFSTIGNGVDILTSIKVSPIMDASDSKGNQLQINLNRDKIKLTGYNHF